MLSFADDRFSTPWILLWDGKGYAVEDIKVKIVFSGNDIESIDVEQRGGRHRAWTPLPAPQPP